MVRNEEVDKISSFENLEHDKWEDIKVVNMDMQSIKFWVQGAIIAPWVEKLYSLVEHHKGVKSSHVVFPFVSCS